MIQRYNVKEITNIWSEETKVKNWLFIELAHIESLHRTFDICKDDYLNIANSLTVDKVIENIDRWKEIESETKHDLQAFVQMLEELVPNNSGRWLHFGLTSSDILDTSTSLNCIHTLNVVRNDLAQTIVCLNKILKSEASNTQIVGRTHGVAAEVQTVGDIVERWLAHARRAYDSLTDAKSKVNVGKLSGAVGNSKFLDKKNEQIALDCLCLKPTLGSQIIPRDIYLDYFYALLKVTLFFEKVAFDIRMYSQEFIEEMSEPFSYGQKGSSAMPHKKNPVLCENICGLARLYKSYMQTAIDNCLTLFERDISHSSNERIIFEDSAHIASFGLRRLNRVLSNLNINVDKCTENVEKVKQKLESQDALNLFISSGYSRKEAHDLSQTLTQS